MTEREREITQQQAERFRAALADPWRELRELEAGYDPVIVRGCTEGVRSVLRELEAKLHDHGESPPPAKEG